MNAPRTCVLVAAVLTGLCLDGSAQAGPRVSAPQASPRYKAIAFDYFVLFNPDSILDEVERVCPGRGRQFLNVWRMRQFEYTWLRSVTGRYVDFLAVTRDALVYTSHAMAVPLTPDQAQRLMDAYLHLDPWPDASGALRQLRDAGIAIVTIANFSPAMLRSNADHAGLTSLFDALISTDANHTYKPDPRAYRLGMDHLHLKKSEIVFAAFGGWDAAGAKSFGYPTVWVNRFNQPIEELGITPDRISPDLSGVLEFVLPTPRAQHR